MTHAPRTRAAARTANLPAVRHDGWTPQKQAAFLNQLAATHCVSSAARAVGMSRVSAYQLRARLKGEPFDLAWQAALICRFDLLAEAALDRALNGVEVPHFYKGEVVGTSRRYDERLTVALLALRASGRGLAGAAAPDPLHPAAQYRPDDFGKLVERVAQGPETWDDEWRIGYAQALAECALPDEDEDGDGDGDGDGA